MAIFTPELHIPLSRWLDLYLGRVNGHWKNSLKIGHVTNTYIGGMYAFTMNSHDPKGLMRLWIDGCERIIALSYPCRLRFLTHMHVWCIVPFRRITLLYSGTAQNVVRQRGSYMRLWQWPWLWQLELRHVVLLHVGTTVVMMAFTQWVMKMHGWVIKTDSCTAVYTYSCTVE